MEAALAHGTELRATSATAMNATSSRSHAVLSVKLAFAGGGQSSLHLVDLAGKQSLAVVFWVRLLVAVVCTAALAHAACPQTAPECQRASWEAFIC